MTGYFIYDYKQQNTNWSPDTSTKIDHKKHKEKNVVARKQRKNKKETSKKDLLKELTIISETD